MDRPHSFPEKIFCIGVNYMNRNAEYKDQSDAPKYPSVFVNVLDCIVHGALPGCCANTLCSFSGTITTLVACSIRCQ